MTSTISPHSPKEATLTADAAPSSTPTGKSEAGAAEHAESTTYSKKEHEAGRAGAAEIAYLWVARAWMDRWKALGGNVGLSYDQEMKPVGVHRWMVADCDLWTPTDEGREDIPPHVWLYRDEHHDGAVKALEGLLAMVPGLQNAVREIAGQEALARWALGKEA
jgi:hypothetical protein